MNLIFCPIGKPDEVVLENRTPKYCQWFKKDLLFKNPGYYQNGTFKMGKRKKREPEIPTYDNYLREN